MGVCADPGSYRWCQALSRSRSFATRTIFSKNCYNNNNNINRSNNNNNNNNNNSNKNSNNITRNNNNKNKKEKIKSNNTTTIVDKSHTIDYKAHPSIYNNKDNSLLNSIRSLGILVAFLILIDSTLGNIQPAEDAVHITAILGESVIFNCHVEFPNDHPVPYVLQWDKKVSDTGSDLPIYIWYENYPTHSGEGYEGRVSRVSADSPFGAASLNLTNIREADQGWYECKVVFLNRDPKANKNGTWFHLDVHAPPRFSVTPEDIIYVNLGDSIILNCQADGTPTPEILWYKDANPVDPSSTVGIFNDGTELRISTIRHEDIGEYTCIARNGEGQVSHTARVIIAGGAVIMVPPTNQTKLEGEKATFQCEAKAMPGNVTVRWFREGSPVREVASLETRVTIRKDGSLIINPVSADDSGQYLCEVSNGIGDPQSASAYLNVEYPAKVTFTPTVQYLPFRLAGIVQCYIKSNPPLQYVTWTKDKRLLEVYQTKDVVIMNNGSLLFTRVNENHQGRYTCTPYNAQGTQGSSGPMEVLVRKPPVFTIEPETLYQRKVGETVEMNCDAQEGEGTQRPNIQWQRQEGVPLQKNRVKINGGNITIDNLRREDFGYYQCVVSNEVATIVSATQLVIEGTQPHAPYNISGKATDTSITLQWMPGYSGGQDYKQDYTIWYREAGISDWLTIPVTPSGSTQTTIHNLAPGTTYEFQVVGRNTLGDGMMSKIVTVRTLAAMAPSQEKTTSAPATKTTKESDLDPGPDGPKPGPPRNLTVTEISNGFLITWQSPLERAHMVKHYTIKYRTDAAWKTLNRGYIRPEETQYLVKNLVGGRTYYFRVLANTDKTYAISDEVKFPVPARVKHKAITAGVVGGFLFFIVAIILSVCAVKICNKRKRRKQEKEFNMVACRITDARNAASRTGSASSSQVPLKKYKQTRISGVIHIFVAILHWIWPPDRCTNCHSIYSMPKGVNTDQLHNVGEIHRSVDGRFVLTSNAAEIIKTTTIIDQDVVDGISQAAADEISDDRRQSTSGGSQYSSSDDGGFLPRRRGGGADMRSSWRRPLVASPSQLSFRSENSARSFLQNLGEFFLQTARRNHRQSNLANYQNIYKNYPLPQTPIISTIQQNIKPSSTNYIPQHNLLSQTPTTSTSKIFTTPSRVSRIFSSSPSSTIGVPSTPWQQTANQFSDLSTVYPGSAERSFPHSSFSTSLNNRFRYSYELPSLRTIQEETRRMNQGFIPLHIPSPSWRGYYHTQTPYHSYRPRTRWYPRHFSRTIRSNSDLLSPLPHLNLSMRGTTYMGNSGLEVSPESRSSSSGFGSKNTSNIPQTQHGSHHSSSTNEWRLLPPYRPPPPPHYHPYYPNFNTFNYNTLLHQQPSLSQSSFTLPHHHNSHQTTSSYLQQQQQQQQQPPSIGNTSIQQQHQHQHPSMFLSRLETSLLPDEKVTDPQENQQQQQQHEQSYQSHQDTPSPPYTMQHWLDMISRLNAATEINSVHHHKSVDVGSVDGHYEFDPSTPTPSASTPTGNPRDELILDPSIFGTLNSNITHHHWGTSLSGFNTLAGPSTSLLTSSGTSSTGVRKQRISRYDNIEARVQAMKEEFYAYRKRQAMKRAGVELESAC